MSFMHTQMAVHPLSVLSLQIKIKFKPAGAKLSIYLCRIITTANPENTQKNVKEKEYFWGICSRIGL